MTNPALLAQIALGSALVNNVVLAYFLGLCPFFGVSRKLSNAAGLGVAVAVMLFATSVVCSVISNLVLGPLGLVHLRLLVFILIIAAVAQAIELFARRFPRSLYEGFGAYIPVVGLNCATVGIALVSTGENPWTGAMYSITESAVTSLAAGLGFALVVLLMAGIRERLEFARIPKALQGLPIALVSAGLMAMAFYGFSAFNFVGNGR